MATTWIAPISIPPSLDVKPNERVSIDVQAIEDLSDGQITPSSDASAEPTIPSSALKHDTLGKLISASLITTNFDALRFNAAASLQIIESQGCSFSTSIPRSHRLISSPYNDPDHLLDLRSLETQSRLLAQALSFLKPIRDDYATADFIVSFNWDEVLAALRNLATAEQHIWTEQSFYTVIFRSTLNKGVDEQRLHDLDKNSHREAVESGGLLKYWFGKRDADERNLASCEYD